MDLWISVTREVLPAVHSRFLLCCIFFFCCWNCVRSGVADVNAHPFSSCTSTNDYDHMITGRVDADTLCTSLRWDLSMLQVTCDLHLQHDDTRRSSQTLFEAWDWGYFSWAIVALCWALPLLDSGDNESQTVYPHLLTDKNCFKPTYSRTPALSKNFHFGQHKNPAMRHGLVLGCRSVDARWYS